MTKDKGGPDAVKVCNLDTKNKVRIVEGKCSSCKTNLHDYLARIASGQLSMRRFRFCPNCAGEIEGIPRIIVFHCGTCHEILYTEKIPPKEKRMKHCHNCGEQIDHSNVLKEKPAETTAKIVQISE